MEASSGSRRGRLGLGLVEGAGPLLGLLLCRGHGTIGRRPDQVHVVHVARADTDIVEAAADLPESPGWGCVNTKVKDKEVWTLARNHSDVKIKTTYLEMLLSGPG